MDKAEMIEEEGERSQTRRGGGRGHREKGRKNYLHYLVSFSSGLIRLQALNFDLQPLIRHSWVRTRGDSSYLLSVIP